MPSSKKPRKAYKPRKTLLGPYYTEEDRAKMEAELTECNLIVECTLQTGNATDEQVDKIEDLIHWVCGIYYRRYKQLDKSEMALTWPLVENGNKAIKAIIDRYETGTCKRYIATGDELKALSECFAFIIPLIKEAMVLAPNKTMKEYFWAKKIAYENFKKRKREKERNVGS